MANFSLDIVSEYDKAEMNNAFETANREIDNRYDFKGTPAKMVWLDDKKGVKVSGNSDWQIESILDIFHKNLINRGLSNKYLDLTKEITTNNMQSNKEVPFVQGLDQEKAKKITKLLRDKLPKIKAQIQGDAVRLTSGSKDDLQAAMAAVKNADFDFAVSFTNFR